MKATFLKFTFKLEIIIRNKNIIKFNQLFLYR